MRNDMTWTAGTLAQLLVSNGAARYIALRGPLFVPADPLPQAGRPGEPEHPETPCLVWTGRLSEKGYGLLTVRGPAGSQVKRRVHGLTFEMSGGFVPAGMMLGHLCERNPCGRPDHVRPVTNQENAREGARRRFPDWLLAMAPLMACPRCSAVMTASVDLRRSEGKVPMWLGNCPVCRSKRKARLPDDALRAVLDLVNVSP